MEERFWNKVKKTSSCWLWVGYVDSKKGYGILIVNKKRSYAHRISWNIHNGEIPKTLVIDHICRNRACVNPQHIRVVTRRINALENSTNRAALNYKKTHCQHGHELLNNCYINKNNHRLCKTCRKILRNSPEYKIKMNLYLKKWNKRKQENVKIT